MSTFNSLPHRSPRIIVLALSLSIVGTASMLHYYFDLFIPRALEVLASKGLGNGYSFGNDLYQVWLTSHASPHLRDLYSPEMTRAIQTGLYGRPLDPRLPSDPIDRRSFPYPAFIHLLFWPAAKVPFPLLRALVVCLLALLTGLTVLLWMKVWSWRPRQPWRTIILLLVLSSYPVLEGLYAGQVGLLVGFLLAAAIYALQRGQLLLSGVLMALTTVKPQVTLLVILYLLVWTSHDWAKRVRFCLGFCLTMFVLVGASLAIWPHWIQSWMQLVVEYHGYTPPPLLTAVLAVAVAPHIVGPVSFAAILALLVSAIALAWAKRADAPDSFEFGLTLSLLLGITVVALLPGQAIYDHGILLPGIFLLAIRRRDLTRGWIPKSILVTGAAMVFWPWIASFGLIVLRHFLTQQQFYSKAVFVLPLRTAGVFPFVALALLTLTLRHKRIADQAPASPLPR
jgi:hypothetical protein